MRSLVSLMTLAVAGVAALAFPQGAAACSCAGTPIYNSDPEDGASGVPLNQALMIEGVFDPSSIRLENDRGEPVEFELNAGPWPGCRGTSADLLPKAPLEPNAHYVIRVEPLVPEAVDPSEETFLEFTTGSTSLPDVELKPPPRGTASVVADAPEAMCGSGNTARACIAVDDTTDLELIMRRGSTVVMRTTTLVQSDGMYALQVAPDCIELRRRAPTGKRSAPLTICGDALGKFEWPVSASRRDNIECRNGLVIEPGIRIDAGTEASAPGVDAAVRAPQGGASKASSRERTADGCTVSIRAESSASSWLLAGICACLSVRRRQR